MVVGQGHRVKVILVGGSFPSHRLTGSATCGHFHFNWNNIRTKQSCPFCVKTRLRGKINGWSQKTLVRLSMPCRRCHLVNAFVPILDYSRQISYQRNTVEVLHVTTPPIRTSTYCGHCFCGRFTIWTVQNVFTTETIRFCGHLLPGPQVPLAQDPYCRSEKDLQYNTLKHQMENMHFEPMYFQQ